VGSTVSYRSGINVTDDHDPNPQLTIDSSRVNLSREGTYPVTYIATDRSGNTARVTANVHVSAVSQEEVTALANRKLRDLGVFNTSDPVRRAELIHRYVYRNVIYLRNPVYDGDDVQIAYNTLLTMKGDCIASQRISETLLTAAGIENMRISNISAAYPHAWNLINIDGLWYHYDASNFEDGETGTHMFTNERAERLSASRFWSRSRLNGLCYVYDVDTFPEVQ
jgi:hypothetical protein